MITYYVDSDNGNDLNSGLSPEQAVRTLNKFSKPPLDAGESHADKSPLPWQPSHVTILLKRGCVFREIASFNRSGLSAKQRLTVGAYGQGARPRLFGVWGQADFINYVTIRDLDIADDVKYGHVGVEWRASGTDCELVNCRVHGHWSGVNVQTLSEQSIDTIVGFAIRKCKIYDNRTGGTPHSQGVYTHGVKDFLIDECVIHDTGNPDDQFDHGYYSHGTAYSGTIQNSIVSTNASVGIQFRGGRFNAINNLITKCAFGITYGSGTNKKQCGGKILKNVVLYGRDLGSNPISCGIAMAMIEDGTEVAYNVIAHKRGSSATSNFGGLCYGNTEAYEYTSLINPSMQPRRKSGNPSVHDNFVIDWAPSLVISERCDGGFTGNYYLVQDHQPILKIYNSRQWSVDAVNRQFILPEQTAEMMSINIWWAPTAKWTIRMDGWDHLPILIDRNKSGIMDPGSQQDQYSFDSMMDVTIERYLQDDVQLPIAECTYERFIEEALRDDGANWATVASFNNWARSRVGLSND